MQVELTVLAALITCVITVLQLISAHRAKLAISYSIKLAATQHAQPDISSIKEYAIQIV